MNNRPQKPRTITESGQFPRPDLSMFTPHESHEPPEPPREREADDPASITGVLPMITEGEDTGKDRDDAASGSNR